MIDTPKTTERERKLLNAAEEVLCRWAIVRASVGKLGDCGMPKALHELDVACEAYSAEECNNAN